MPDAPLQVTYLGGPTVLIEVDGVRLLTDPTFDPAGTTYPTGRYTLRKRKDRPFSRKRSGASMRSS